MSRDTEEVGGVKRERRLNSSRVPVPCDVTLTPLTSRPAHTDKTPGHTAAPTLEIKSVLMSPSSHPLKWQKVQGEMKVENVRQVFGNL